MIRMIGGKGSLLLSILSACIVTTHGFTPSPLIRNQVGRTNKIRILAPLSRKDASSNEEAEEPSTNPFMALFSNIGQKAPASKVETEEERLVRLKREELERLEEKEVERAERVKQDSLPYLLLLALQFLPLVGTERVESVAYFFGVAVITVYLGGRQVTLVEEEERVTSESALFAPVAASISIGILYLLINSGINPAALYAAGVTLFGGLAISDIGVPILRNVLPEGFASGKVKVPKKVSDSFGLVDEELPLDGLVTLLLGLSFTAAYWSPFAMEQKFLVSNFIAWALAMTSLGAISLGSFQTAAILLAGLFAYDIFWVFGTPVMMTVATKVEAPVKFLYTAPPLLEGAEPREYPFSVLGLGDVVIPGLFVRFMTKLDTALQPQTIGYFNGATAAYALGLSACFVVNEITHSGQPALLYLDPACIGSALAVGALNGQLADVWNFEEPENE